MSKLVRPRRTGVLMPLFSLRTPTGWGLGEIPDLEPFARWAARAGFSVLGLLPVNEVTGGETSPYSASSAFALDPVYIGLDACEDFGASGGRAALSGEDRALLDALAAGTSVIWGDVRRLKRRALDRAFAHFLDREWATNSGRARGLGAFIEEQAAWLTDHALFSALHDRHRTHWRQWPEPLRRRDPQSLGVARRELEIPILFQCFCQWHAALQWSRARAGCLDAGVGLMGDLPFVVSADSADVWARQEEFALDRTVGTPPDAFSATGQDWGLPAYAWPAMQRTDFSWMRARAGQAGALYSLYRVDHVIGLYRTYSRSADGQDAGFSPDNETDQIRLGDTLLGLFKAAGPVVAEDLGLVPNFLRKSLTALGIPGYRVLRWERKADGSYRDPSTWPALSVATSGTHDIEPNATWWDALGLAERRQLVALPGLGHLEPDSPFSDAVRDALLRIVYASPSELAIIPFQDALGTRERINTPGTVSPANWSYRMAADVGALRADAGTSYRLATLARETNRVNGPWLRHP